MVLENCKVIIEPRANGIEPAIIVIDGEDKVRMITITPDRNFDITDEGIVGERYDHDGKWCGK